MIIQLADLNFVLRHKMRFRPFQLFELGLLVLGTQLEVLNFSGQGRVLASGNI